MQIANAKQFSVLHGGRMVFKPIKFPQATNLEQKDFAIVYRSVKTGSYLFGLFKKQYVSGGCYRLAVTQRKEAS
jgi:hypothetical protein